MMTIQQKTELFKAKVAAMVKPAAISSTKNNEVSDEKKEVDGMEESTSNSDIKLSSYNLRPKYSSVNINADKWLLTMDEESRAKLENPPSLADGFDRKTEEDLRYLGCELIQTGALLLRLPQTAAATGQIIFQRFYYQKSFAVHHFEYAVMACLLLASKIEEAYRRPRDIINVFHRLEQLHKLRRAGKSIKREVTSRLPIRPLDGKYLSTRDMMTKTEKKILSSLGFVVHVKHPHKLIFSYLHSLSLTDRRDLMQKAWSYMNDGLRTDMFLRYTPETIACACIFLAARTVEPPVALPSTPFNWFELFDASDRDVEAIAIMLLKLYKRKQVNWTALGHEVERIHELKVPKKEETNKAELIAKKIVKEGRRNGENDENGRGRSRSRSYERRRRDGREGREDRRRESPDERKRRDKRGEERRDRKEKDRRREEKRRRSRDRMNDKAKEHTRQREREVHQALAKRNREGSPRRK